MSEHSQHDHDPAPPERLLSAGALRMALDTPWRVRLELRRWLSWPGTWLIFALAGVRWGRGWRFYGVPILQKHRRSTLTIGDGLSLRSTPHSNALGPNHPVILSTRRPGARLVIGRGFGMTGGTICAEESITIGDDVWVGANCVITDTDFHPLDLAARLARPLDGATAPVIIEDGVFIGMNSLVLKGVTIGAGSVIGAGSIVTRSLPPGVIAAGNPARPIRPLDAARLRHL
ncbi:MAG: acyltransferase [Anaerolineae bacterium]|nr:acyltransferase [Anaerolineae bacterium]MEB2287728.1 acyltransferase [Anaerolineae bacterium]